MKRFLLLLVAAWLALGVGKNPRLAYIDRYSSLAVLEMQRTGVPASITLAQAILESGSGQSPLATVANNHFGLKCHNDWQGEKFFYDDETPDECFRVYTTVEDSYRAHSDFLRGRERYQSLFELDPTDYKGWAKGLRRAGYATDPGYATKLINLIEDFQLYRFDTMTEDDLPAGQEEEAAPETVPAEEVAPAGGAVPTEETVPAEEAQPEQTVPEAAPVVIPPVVTPPAVPEHTVRDERYFSDEEEETPAPPAYKESVSLSLARQVYQMNGVRYVRAVEGETWQSLAAEYRLSLRQLLSYNDLEAPIELHSGMRVYLGRKKAEAEPGYGLYEVEEDGVTLWDISQMFGIQLKKLRLYNIFQADAPFEAGDTVILRRL